MTDFIKNFVRLQIKVFFEFFKQNHKIEFNR